MIEKKYDILHLLFFGFNAILMLWGLLIAIFITVFYSSVSPPDEHVTKIFSLVLVFGIIIIITASFGCYGTIRESQRILVAFVGLLLATLVYQVAIWIWIFNDIPVNEQGFRRVVGGIMAVTIIFKLIGLFLGSYMIYRMREKTSRRGSGDLELDPA